MPTKNNDILRNSTLKSLKNFPKIMKPYMALVREMEGMVKFKREWTPAEILENWSKYSNQDKYYFIGWFRAALKKIGFGKAMAYIALRDKQKIDAAMVSILDYATDEELKAFRKGEDSVNIRR